MNTDNPKLVANACDLETLNSQLQQLIETLELSVQSDQWSELAELDQQVNRLVHFCVVQGRIKEPSIHHKVLFLARLYRRVIEQVTVQRDSVAKQLQQEKRRHKMANSYQIANNICA